MDLTTTFSIQNASMKNSPLWMHLIAGGIAGAISRTCTAPADRIKVYLQVNKKYQSFFGKTVSHACYCYRFKRIRQASWNPFGI